MVEGIDYTSEDCSAHDAIGVVIKDDLGRILMQDHVKLKLWTIPLGKAKSYESPEEGVVTELKEECGITPIDLKKILSKEVVFDRYGKDVPINIHVYELLSYSGEIQNLEPHKHKSQIFMSVDEIRLLEKVSVTTRLYLESLD